MGRLESQLQSSFFGKHRNDEPDIYDLNTVLEQLLGFIREVLVDAVQASPPARSEASSVR